MLMTAFDQAWDLLKALNPMPGEEGLPEEELRHYLNYMRQKENFTPQGRKKPQEPQVMGEGATVSDTAAPSFESTLQNLPLDKLERLALAMSKPYRGYDIEKAAIEKAFAILKRRPPAFDISGMQPFDEKQQRTLDAIEQLEATKDVEGFDNRRERTLLDKDIREYEDRMRIRMQQEAMNMMGNPSNIDLMSYEEPLRYSMPSYIESQKHPKYR